MSHELADLPCDAVDTPIGAPSPEGTLQQRIRTLLGNLYPRGRVCERRRETRYPFPYLIHLQPVLDDDLTPAGEPIVVVGRQISEGGLGFFHPEPLPYRRVVASISPTDGAARLDVLLDLTWCRFTRHGWYEGGGRFLQEVATTLVDEPPAAVFVTAVG